MYERADHTDNSLVDAALAVLAHRPSALVTDIDGTISPIVPDPMEARVLPEARQALRCLDQTLDFVAAVSGRQSADARRMVGLDELSYVGNHGLDMLDGDTVSYLPQMVPWVPVIAETVECLRQGLREPGMLLENKGASGSIHYRQTADPEKARLRIMTELAQCPVASQLRIEEGRMVVNLLPPLRVSKGSTVRWMIRERGLKAMIYLGDDITDQHAFDSLRRLREEEGIHTLSIVVADPETGTSVLRAADRSVSSPQAAAEFLACVAERLLPSPATVPATASGNP